MASDLEVGYGNWAKISLEDAVNPSSGNIYVFVGSYGVRFRGGSHRGATIDSTEKITNGSTYPTVGISQNSFDATYGKVAYLEIKVDLVDETTATVSLRLTNRTSGKISAETQYNLTRLASNEVETAKVYIAIDGAGTTSLTVRGKDAE